MGSRTGLDSHRANGASHVPSKGGGGAVPSIEGAPVSTGIHPAGGCGRGGRADDLERQVKGAMAVTQTTRKRHKMRGQRGQTMVEFAIVLPIFLMLLLGIAQGGIAFNNYVQLTDATRAGARFGAPLGVQRHVRPLDARHHQGEGVRGEPRPRTRSASPSRPRGRRARISGSAPRTRSRSTSSGSSCRSGNLNSCTTERVE